VPLHFTTPRLGALTAARPASVKDFAQEGLPLLTLVKQARRLEVADGEAH